MRIRDLLIALAALHFGLGAPAAMVLDPAQGIPPAVYLGAGGSDGSPTIAALHPNGIETLAPAETCSTYQRFLARQDGRGPGSPRGVCPQYGPCDDPLNRDASIPAAGTPIKIIRLSIHVFCDDNGSNCAATQDDVDVAVARLNTNFGPWGVQFVYQSNFINSTRYRTLSSSEEFAMKRSYADSPASKLNIYVLDSGSTSWATFPWDPDALTAQGGIVMGETFFGVDSVLPGILTHELGHCVGLWHTFHGVSEVPACGDCYEPAGRSAAQGDVTGDWCSDTNPTLRDFYQCFDPSGTDACSGNTWVDTPWPNYMGNSHSCFSEFTPQQAGRMHCWTAAVLSGWLQLPERPATPGTPTLAKLAGGVIRVDWADNSNNEDGFRVQREKKSGANWVETQIVAVVGANITTVNDAPGLGTFRYRVQSYNVIGDSAWSGWRQIKN